MANSLDDIAPKILARGVMQLRETAIMPRLVNTDFSAETAEKGDTITVPVPGAITVRDVVPSHEQPDPPDTTASTVAIPLRFWRKAAFFLTDKEMMQIDADTSFIPFQMQEAIAALAASVNTSLLQLAPEIGQIIGLPGKPLFSQKPEDLAAEEEWAGVKPAILARQMLNRAQAPKMHRYGVLGFDHEATALALPQFADAGNSGDSTVRLKGQIGEKYGITWLSDDGIRNNSQRLVKDFNLRTNHPKGATTVNFANLDYPMSSGDIVLTATGKLLGVINQQTAWSSVEKTATCSLHEGLSQAVSSSTKLIRPGGYQNNLVFHRNAFALAIRPLAANQADYSLGSRMMSVTDPQSGLSLRLEISRQYKQTVWEFDILWGVALVRPQLAIRLVS